MSTSEICNHEAIIFKRDNSILEAAQRMRQHHVGNGLIAEDRDGIKVSVDAVRRVPVVGVISGWSELLPWKSCGIC